MTGQDAFTGRLRYMEMFEMGVTKAGCLAHARRKFHELWVHHQSVVAEEALKFFGRFYGIERELQGLGIEERR